jgi:hypothetical protein
MMDSPGISRNSVEFPDPCIQLAAAKASGRDWIYLIVDSEAVAAAITALFAQEEAPSLKRQLAEWARLGRQIVDGWSFERLIIIRQTSHSMNEAIAEADEGTHSNQWGMVDLPRVGPSRVELMGLGSTMDRRYNVMLKKHLANSQVYRFAKRQGMSSWRAAGDFITEVTIWSASLTRDERRFAESLGTGRLEDNEVRAAHAPDQVHAMGRV